MQEGWRSSPLGPHRSRTKVPRRGTSTAKQLLVSWLKFLCEALGRSSLRTKLRASSMHLHGLSNKIGSSTRSASSMHRGVRGDSSESLKRYRHLQPVQHLVPASLPSPFPKGRGQGWGLEAIKNDCMASLPSPFGELHQQK